MLYKLLVVYEPDLFPGKSDSDVKEELENAYSGYADELTVESTIGIKDYIQFNDLLERNTAIQIIAHGNKNAELETKLFDGKKKILSYNDLFCCLGIDFSNIIVFLCPCYSGDVQSILSPKGMRIPYPSFVLAYANKVGWNKIVLDVLSFAHKTMKEYLNSIKKTGFKIDPNKTPATLGDDKLLSGPVLRGIYQHEARVTGRKRRTSTAQPGFALVTGDSKAHELLQFLLDARVKSSSTKSVLAGSIQFEYRSGDLFYRNVYYLGRHQLNGMETVYRKDRPVWSMVYHGNWWSSMTKDEVREVLEAALTACVGTARINERAEWQRGIFIYRCDGKGLVSSFSGIEAIMKDSEQVYKLGYWGGWLD